MKEDFDKNQEENENIEYKRRVRYKGKYPKKFNEKYKELQPEKYAHTIEKVTKKGNTPAGTHIPICVNEILNFLQIEKGQKGLDATLGYGGHTSEILKKLDGQGHLFAFDTDPIEIEKTKERIAKLGYSSEVFTAISTVFDDKENLQAVAPLDFILADLGLSSMQIDNPERGFSFKFEGPLDLRLNPNIGIPAYEMLKNCTKDEIAGMLFENSDEPYAQEIATSIIKHYKKGGKIETTTHLKNIIDETLSKFNFSDHKDVVKKSCQRTFQAIRIDINSEYEVLESFLNQIPEILVDGGRIAILTFHSGEDRLVKKSFKRFYKEGIYSEIATDVIRPSKEERIKNPRSTSAKLRWAIK